MKYIYNLHRILREEAGGSGDDGSGGTPPATPPNPPNSDESGRYQAKFEAEKAARIKSEKEFSEFRRKFEQIDPEKYNELIKANEQREIDDKKRRGEFDKLEIDLRGQIKSRDDQIKTLQQQIEDQDLSYRLGDAFVSGDARGKVEFRGDYIAKAKNFMAKDPETGEWKVQSPQGGRLFMDEAGTEAVETPEQLAIYLRENTPYGIYYNPIQGKGSGSSGSSTPLDGGSDEDLLGMELL